MSLGEEIRKALEASRADAASMKITNEVDKVFRDNRNTRWFKPVELILDELEKSFTDSKSVAFSNMSQSQWCYIDLTKGYASNWKITISLEAFNPDDYHYSFSVKDVYSLSYTSNYYGIFYPGSEHNMLLAVIDMIAHFETNGSLLRIDHILDRYPDYFARSSR